LLQVGNPKPTRVVSGAITRRAVARRQKLNIPQDVLRHGSFSAMDDYYTEAIRAAAAQARDAEAAKQVAVTAARVAGVTWTDVGDALGVTRQAARERYTAVEQVAKAWKAIESHLSEVGARRGMARSTAEMVEVLRAEGSLDDRDVNDLNQLLHRYSEAMRGATISVREAELLTNHAIPLSGKVFVLTLTDAR
jgi:hypothetical protein